MRSLSITLTAWLAFAVMGTPGTASAAEGVTASLGQQPKFIRQTPPVYPMSALSRHIEGFVRVEYGIDANGNVVAPHIIEASPPGVFDAAALAAVSKWRYEARSTPTERVNFKVVFKGQ